MNSKSPKTILLVEDEPLLAKVEGLTIEKFGYKVIFADTGEKAVETCEKSPDIDLVLMDINLGAGIDGPEAAKQILAKRHIPIVFLTSHMEKEYVDKVKQITRYGYVIKNSTPFVLQSSIEMAFELFEANKDIESKKRALDFTNERLSKYFHTAGVMLCSLDSDGKVTSINQKGCEVFGLEEREIIGKNWFDSFLPKNIISEIKKVFQSIISGNLKPVEYYENPILKKCGEERIIAFHNTIIKDENNNINGILFSGEDITERKKAEQLVQASEKRFKALAEATTNFVWVTNAYGELIEDNKGWKNFTGQRQDEIRGSGWLNALHPEDREQANAIWVDAICM